MNATSLKGVSVPTAQSTRHDTPNSADACQRSCGKNNTGTPTGSRIGVTAAWHRQQSTTSTLWDYPCPKGVVVWWLDCKPETPTARDSSAFTRRRMSTACPPHPRTVRRASAPNCATWEQTVLIYIGIRVCEICPSVRIADPSSRRSTCGCSRPTRSMSRASVPTVPTGCETVRRSARRGRSGAPSDLRVHDALPSSPFPLRVTSQSPLRVTSPSSVGRPGRGRHA